MFRTIVIIRSITRKGHEMNYQRTRSGWNTRGGTLQDDLEAARTFWESQARQKANTLKGWLKDDYPVFEEMIFPGETFDRMSWQQINGTLENWIASGKSAVMDALKCACSGDARCAACQARRIIQERYGRHWSDDPKHYSGAEY